MTTLFVTGLEFYAYHGVPAEERALGHRYIVDIELAVDSQAQHTDEISDTVDYAAAAGVLQQVSASNQFKTVERLAHMMAETLLETFPRIQTVSIRLAKRLPPAPFIADELGVEYELQRSPRGNL